MTDFEAMSVYDAGEDDILNTLDKLKREYPSMNYVKGSMEYLTYQSGSSNKFHIFMLAQDKSGNYFAFNGAARIGYNPQIHRIAGPTSQEQAAGAMRRKMRQKERKGYVNRSKDFRSIMSAEYVVTESGLPVIPDSYGTNSALDSGQGVPVWYGSAEGDDKANSARKLVEMLGSRKIEVNSIDNFVKNFTRDTDFHELSDDELDIIFRDGSMATMIADKVSDGYEISTVVVAYDSEHHKGQGYDDEMDESLGMRHRGSHKQSMKDRRDEASAMDKKYGMMRKYDDVMAMDAEDYVVLESGLPVIPDSYGTNSALDSGQGVPQWYGSAEFTQEGLGRSGVSGYVTWDGKIMRCMRCHAAARQAYGPETDPYFSCGKEECIETKGNALEVRAETEDYNYQSTMGDIDSAPFTEGTVNPMTFTRLGAYDFPVIDNSEGGDSAIGGHGVPEWYGSAEGDYTDFDKTEYEYKDVELVKPFKTGFLGALGVIMAPVAVTFSAALLGMFFNRGE